MRIVIRPSTAENRHPVSVEITKALGVLRTATIQTDGGGTVGLNDDTYGVILLSRETDIPRAIEALAQAGISASET
jgi:hypothetical protein